jgi:type II secretory pathway pseudopilin PulG
VPRLVAPRHLLRTVSAMRLRRAFTALEMSVVMLGIAVLSASLTLSFGGADQQAADRTAQANASAALDAALAATSSGVSSPNSVTPEEFALLVAEGVPEIAALPKNAPAAGPGQVSVGWGASGGHEVFGVAALATDGSCWMARRARGLSPDELDAPGGRELTVTLLFPGSIHDCSAQNVLDRPWPAPAADAGTGWRNPYKPGQ